ncbi:MAG: hypothetical protein MAG715_00379 [Methanonatronarchaeales archaeon]|nr:hypothetical protein [Methanonatronarchaeales archaeon]
MKVRELMVEPLTVDKSDHLSHAIDRMEKAGSSWIVVTSSGEPVGVTGYRDLGIELGSVKKRDLPASALHVATATRGIDEPLSWNDDVSEGAKRLTEMGVGTLPVFDEDGGMVGMLRDEELLALVDSGEPVSSVMEAAMSLSPDDRLVHARQLMLDNDVWRLPVVESGRLVGMLTETDVAKTMKSFRDLVPGDQQDTRVRNILVEDVMSTDMTSCRDSDPVRDARDLLLENDVGGLPVLDRDGDLSGMVTRSYIIKLLV